MRSFRPAVAGLLLGALTLSGSPASATPTIPDPTPALPAPTATGATGALTGAPRILAIGDSITCGLEGDYTWRYRLAAHLGPGYEFVGRWSKIRRLTRLRPTDPQAANHVANYRPGLSFDSDYYAAWGWTFARARAALRDEITVQRPDYVLIQLGFNDVVWKGVTPAGAFDQLSALVQQIRRGNPTARFVLGTVTHRTTQRGLEGANERITRWNAYLRENYARLDSPVSPVALAPVSAGFQPTRHTYDGVHPNVRGEYVIAQAYADTLALRFGVGRAYGALPESTPRLLGLARPTGLRLERRRRAVRLSWPHTFGASGYRVWRRDVTAGARWRVWNRMVDHEVTRDATVWPGHVFAYKVAPLRGRQVGASGPVRRIRAAR